ncbi:AAA family ATPase [Melghirimyces algeriensis]|uniref:AAA domain-containing protein n=1 Tax=Melghirimyces algeriensis TaxID=910412 RepID=A0A521F3F9_9BACL|nr:AAA domain-containing protein [Melghirimyces algeriensis]
MGVFLREIKFVESRLKKTQRTEYPFCIPAIQTLNQLTFETPVTFFVGENGSGKSTILEAIADQCGFNTASGSRDHLYIFASEKTPSFSYGDESERQAREGCFLPLSQA